MKNINLYNKYRPDSFKSIIGQNVIKTILLNSLKTEKLIQAYLFYGPHGTGKTCLARIYAKAVNCQCFDGEDICNKCKNCTLINENKTLDIIEVDASSNNGIEYIRELISSIEYLPLNLGKKVYIIDEAHGLSSQSWNALLKSIEEPPSHVLFIFLTTQINKILPTILSRCQKMKFSFLNEDELRVLVSKICASESRAMEDSVIHKSIMLSRGSAREMMTILDQLFLHSSQKIELDHYEKAFGLLGHENILNFTELLLKNKKSEALSFLDKIWLEGSNLIHLFEEIFGILVELETVKQTGDMSLLRMVDSSRFLKFKDLSSWFLPMCDLLNKTLQYKSKNVLLQFKNLLVHWFAYMDVSHDPSAIYNTLKSVEPKPVAAKKLEPIKSEFPIKQIEIKAEEEDDNVEKKIDTTKKVRLIPDANATETIIHIFNRESKRKSSDEKISSKKTKIADKTAQKPQTIDCLVDSITTTSIKQDTQENQSETTKSLKKTNSLKKPNWDTKKIFYFTTEKIFPESVSKLISENINFVDEILYIFKNSNREDTAKNYDLISKYLDDSDASSKIKNLFINFCREYQLITADKAVLVIVVDEKSSHIFQKNIEEPSMQEQLDKIMGKKYLWYSIPKKQISIYSSQAKGIDKNVLDEKKLFEEKSNDLYDQLSEKIF